MPGRGIWYVAAASGRQWRTRYLFMHWCDEGKGKIVDLLAAFDVVARYIAGHKPATTSSSGTAFSLNLIPSGILHPAKCVLGNDVDLTRGILRRARAPARCRVRRRRTAFVSLGQCCCAARGLDQAREAARGADKSAPRRGIASPTAQGGRIGLRMCDLSRPAGIPAAAQVQRMKPELLILAPTVSTRVRCGLLPFVALTAEAYLRDPSVAQRWIRAGKSVLFEGAQGTLLTWTTAPSRRDQRSFRAAAPAPARRTATAISGDIVVLSRTHAVGVGPFPPARRRPALPARRRQRLWHRDRLPRRAVAGSPGARYAPCSLIDTSR